MSFKKSTITLLLLATSIVAVKAQSLPVGTPVLEDYYRRNQLLGHIDSATSFTIRPLQPTQAFKINNAYLPDSAEYQVDDFARRLSFNKLNGNLVGTLLPLSAQTQFNTHHPYGWNDGAMIPAKGLQTLFSAGFYAKLGILSVQFRPELVWAANTYFDNFDKNHYEIIAARYYDVYNNIDLPVRFGNKMYSRAYWGQSSVRLNYKSLSFGLSTENLWWGPGMRNSLLMTNSAPGFKHLTLNTTKPIKTAIGSFEGQLIAGRLENSGYPPTVPERQLFGNPLYVEKPTDWRYLSGIVLTWQPKWVSGLFLGVTRTAQSYAKDLSGIGDYFPFFSQYKDVSADQPYSKRDERRSVFTRFIWTQEHAEIYFEYGINNNTNTFRNSLLDPQNSRAYVFGLRKLLPINLSKNEYFSIGVEAAQLQQTSIDKILSIDQWYVNKYVRQGYTNRGELLGAGIGPGANLQTLNLSWFKGLKKIGLQLERLVHNDDFYYYAYEDSGDFRRHWVDLSVAAVGEWNYKNFIFNAQLSGIKSINYQWYLLQNPGDPYWVNGKTALNIQLQAGLTYRF